MRYETKSVIENHQDTPRRLAPFYRRLPSATSIVCRAVYGASPCSATYFSRGTGPDLGLHMEIEQL